MEISPPAKSPDTDQAEQTPKIHPGKPLPFTNGVLKRHAPPHAPPLVLYKECMKNHAAAMGGHALDGCGEFMPSPSTIPSDPTSLTCAACGCHRNFHRRNSPSPAPPTHVIEYHPHHRHHPPPPYGGLGGARSPGASPSPPPISSSYYPASAPHMLLALSSGGGAGAEPPLTSPHSRKRFRTKFSQDQKDKMHEFAEKLGWKMQKASDDLVSAFCADVGVERGVFKVWMHNNKNTFAKHRDPTAGPAPALPAPSSGTALIDPNNGSSGNSSHGYSKNGDGTYGSSTSS